MIETRFGVIPARAEQRPNSQSLENLVDLGVRLIDGQTLEDGFNNSST
jgi:hypothetical protein